MPIAIQRVTDDALLHLQSLYQKMPAGVSQTNVTPKCTIEKPFFSCPVVIGAFRRDGFKKQQRKRPILSIKYHTNPL
jgi:hypothetical protein